MAKKGLVSKIDGKTNDDFNLRREDRLRLVNTKQKLCILFGIPLALHYLCHCIAKIGVGSEMQTKNFVFCLVFRSPCTTFARCEDTDPLTNVS